MAGEEVGSVLELVVALPPRDEEISDDSNKEETVHEEKVGHCDVVIKQPKMNQVAGNDGANVALEGLVRADLGHNLYLANPLSHKVLDAVTACNGHAESRKREDKH